MTDFESGLRSHLNSKSKLSAKEQQIMGVLDAPDSKRRTRRMHRMENHARASIDAHPEEGAIDWSKIDWSKILQMLIKFITMIFAL